jgi:Zn ribbon nucleic-acid-binding protein
MTRTTAAVACSRCQSTDCYCLEWSKDAVIDYYRCNGCGHVWTQPKPGQPGERHDVTSHPSDPKLDE